ncbi:beta-aspartyl-peptidase [Alteromonas facilis]|uniref:beta-aspartyl-peptidase n=1 Tax=Alteromonas facilis TaxID=2048004 RepID=UPI000C285838|nr:beta-aspartyl-peptidase [Alteromonas facilis]
MLTLIKGVDVYAPSPLGINDILIADGRIAAISPAITLTGEPVQHFNGDGLIAFPGLVDSLVHISGGGGEGGFHTRTPAMKFTDASSAGVTTVIGALGTDATTRSLGDLIACARALNNQGLSAYCYTGSYQVPARTLTGSITDDIVLIDSMIGIGEVAIADHRGSQPSAAELARIASDSRVGGMLAGKAGIVFIHTGEASEQLSLLHQVVDQYPIQPTQFYPTHINRNQQLLDAGIEWTKRGGVIDMTASTNEHFIAEGEIPAAEAIAYCLNKGVPPSQLSMSSDGNASLPVFDNNGQLVGIEVGKVGSLMQSLRELTDVHSVNLSDALQVVTSTPAAITGLAQKGQLAVGCDADIVLCQGKSPAAQHVMAKGQWLIKDNEVLVKGTFE